MMMRMSKCHTQSWCSRATHVLALATLVLCVQHTADCHRQWCRTSQNCCIDNWHMYKVCQHTLASQHCTYASCQCLYVCVCALIVHC